MFRILRSTVAACGCLAIVFPAATAAATSAPWLQDGAQRKVRVTGVVRDQQNAITLPGIPVTVVGTGEIVYTDVDGRYTVDLSLSLIHI